MYFIASRIYTVQKTRLFQAKLPKRADDGGKLYDLGRGDMRVFGVQTLLGGVQTDIPTSPIRITTIRSSR